MERKIIRLIEVDSGVLLRYISVIVVGYSKNSIVKSVDDFAF